jgi:putative flippase GtrA
VLERFGVAGVLNTLIDYTLFIALTRAFSVPLSTVWVPKLASGLVAMCCSFAINRNLVFRRSGAYRVEAWRFVLVTAVAVVGIHPAVTQLFANVTTFGDAAWSALRASHIPRLAPSLITRPLAVKTVAFAIAGVCSLVWNFTLYNAWVFGDRPTGDVG